MKNYKITFHLDGMIEVRGRFPDELEEDIVRGHLLAKAHERLANLMNRSPKAVSFHILDPAPVIELEEYDHPSKTKELC